MKLFLSFLLLSIFAISAYAGGRIIVQRDTPMKHGPKVVGTVSAGTAVTVLKSQGQWRWVESNGQRGWVHQNSFFISQHSRTRTRYQNSSSHVVPDSHYGFRRFHRFEQGYDGDDGGTYLHYQPPGNNYGDEEDFGKWTNINPGGYAGDDDDPGYD